MNQNSIETFENIETSNRTFDFKKAFYRALQYWYYIPIFLLLAIAFAVYTYKITTPKYQISAQLMITGNNSSRGSIGADDGAFRGVTLGVSNDVENQLIILTSTKQVEKTLKQLDFSVSYYQKGIFLTKGIVYMMKRTS